ncbi:putative heterokaryon incompatibility protein [Rosellinia necatrix]|uniref:Putative heterokaryon incompatibility protein n=1 Tax=Rosellinia necatrix TaxID=77044 RepID=A0A1S8A698_ROSNE|nr:putative heterokaryon incompatibility protein [Rosellinia necatrix]
MQLCSHCKVFQQTLAASYSWTSDISTFLHQPSYTALLGSADVGCGLCKILVEALSDIDQLEEARASGFEFGHDNRPIYPDGSIYLVYCGAQDGSFNCEITIESLQVRLGYIRGHELPRDWKDPWDKDETDDHAKAIAAIGYWTGLCLSQHPGCQRGAPHDFIPTRVVEVGDTGDEHVRLIHPGNENLHDKRYVALSHCWGRNMPSSATTTQAVLCDRLELIPLTHLTTTFVDAIRITRALGIPYLWIDALCIVQDSFSDWDAEASAMAAIYRGAYLTLAASGSSNGTQGCRLRNGSLPYVDMPISKRGEKSSYRMCAWSNFNHDHMDRDPLHSRSWSLQERELSSRIAHFSRDTVQWECYQSNASLVFPWHDPMLFASHRRIFDFDSTPQGDTIFGSVLSGTVTSGQSWIVTREWIRLVGLYSKRQLSRQTDILPAISGMARVWGGFTPGGYHAGHFVLHGFVGLLWQTGSPDGKGKRQAKRCLPDQYTAPSWSWASIVGEVSWATRLLLAGYCTESLADIVEMGTELQGRDEFGMVKAGMLRIKGRVKQFCVGRARDDPQFSQRMARQYLFPDAKERGSIGVVSFDVLDEAHETILAIACAKTGRNFSFIFGLALAANEKGPQGQTFRRIGQFFAYVHRWDIWENVSVTEVSIV